MDCKRVSNTNISFQNAKNDLDTVRTQAAPLKSRLQAANNSSEIIDYSAPVERVARLLDGTESLREDVADKIHWLTDVVEKTSEFNTAVTEMEEWLPKVEKSAECLGPMSTDLEIIKDQIKAVQVRWSFVCNICK